MIIEKLLKCGATPSGSNVCWFMLFVIKYPFHPVQGGGLEEF